MISIQLNEKAIIPSSRRKHKRARTLDAKLFSDYDEKDNGSGSDNNTEEDEHINISYYASGAISTHTVKPKIRKARRAKSHIHIDDTEKYNYDSIWNVKSDAMINNESYHIETVMDKPCVMKKRKHKSHNVDVNALS